MPGNSKISSTSNKTNKTARKKKEALINFGDSKLSKPDSNGQRGLSSSTDSTDSASWATTNKIMNPNNNKEITIIIIPLWKILNRFL